MCEPQGKKRGGFRKIGVYEKKIVAKQDMGLDGNTKTKKAMGGN